MFSGFWIFRTGQVEPVFFKLFTFVDDYGELLRSIQRIVVQHTEVSPVFVDSELARLAVVYSPPEVVYALSYARGTGKEADLDALTFLERISNRLKGHPPAETKRVFRDLEIMTSLLMPYGILEDASLSNVGSITFNAKYADHIPNGALPFAGDIPKSNAITTKTRFNFFQEHSGRDPGKYRLIINVSGDVRVDVADKKHQGSEISYKAANSVRVIPEFDLSLGVARGSQSVLSFFTEDLDITNDNEMKEKLPLRSLMKLERRSMCVRLLFQVKVSAHVSVLEQLDVDFKFVRDYGSEREKALEFTSFSERKLSYGALTEKSKEAITWKIVSKSSTKLTEELKNLPRGAYVILDANFDRQPPEDLVCVADVKFQARAESMFVETSVEDLEKDEFTHNGIALSHSECRVIAPLPEKEKQ